jgi:hypothetical protein
MYISWPDFTSVVPELPEIQVMFQINLLYFFHESKSHHIQQHLLLREYWQSPIMLDWIRPAAGEIASKQI